MIVKLPRAVEPALAHMAKGKQAGLGVADSFLPSSSTLGRFSHKAVQTLLVTSGLPVIAPLLGAVEPKLAHRAPKYLPKGIIIQQGQQGPRQLWGWLRLRLSLHLFGQHKIGEPCLHWRSLNLADYDDLEQLCE